MAEKLCTLRKHAGGDKSVSPLYFYCRGVNSYTLQSLIPADILNKYKYIALSTTHNMSYAPVAPNTTTATYYVDMTGDTSYSATGTITTSPITIQSLNASINMFIGTSLGTTDRAMCIKLYN